MLGRFVYVAYFTLVFVFFFIVAHRQLYLPEGTRATTIQSHVGHAQVVAERPRTLPHKGFFHVVIALHRFTRLPYFRCGLIALASFATLTALVSYWILKYRLPSARPWALLLTTLLLMTAGSVYLPMFNRAVYFGQGSPAMWHNATFIALKPFALIAFTMNVALLNRSSMSRSGLLLFVTAAMNALTVYIKPTFLIVLTPAFILRILPRLARPGRIILLLGALFIPACLLLLYEYTQIQAGDGRKVGFVFFSIWKLFTPSIPVSILLALAFPLAVSICTWPRAVKNEFFRMAWLLTFVGLTQFAFLAEFNRDGVPMYTANWIGGYLIALSILFLFSMEEFLRWLETLQATRRGQRLRLVLISALLTWHTLSGWYYLSELLVNGRTTVVWYGTPEGQ